MCTGYPVTTTNSFFLNAGLSDCPASSQSGTGKNKNTDAGTIRYQNKGTQYGTGILWYWTKIQDAGMPMPAASTTMAMPSYVISLIEINTA
jgi:hypothetical protein